MPTNTCYCRKVLAHIEARPDMTALELWKALGGRVTKQGLAAATSQLVRQGLVITSRTQAPDETVTLRYRVTDDQGAPC